MFIFRPSFVIWVVWIVNVGFGISTVQKEKASSFFGFLLTFLFINFADLFFLFGWRLLFLLLELKLIFFELGQVFLGLEKWQVCLRVGVIVINFKNLFFWVSSMMILLFFFDFWLLWNGDDFKFWRVRYIRSLKLNNIVKYCLSLSNLSDIFCFFLLISLL